jgi:hypothetical protein
MNPGPRQTGHSPESVHIDRNLPELPDRSRTMHLMHEDLARVHIAERQAEAARMRRINRIRAARRLARRAERASQRARRALALASLPQ